MLRAALDGGLLTELKRYLSLPPGASGGSLDPAQAAHLTKTLTLLQGLPVTVGDLQVLHQVNLPEDLGFEQPCCLN